MARLPKGEREQRLLRIFRLLQRHRFGIKESEVAEDTGLGRRTVNNYLLDLRAQRKARKEGRYWFAE